LATPRPRPIALGQRRHVVAAQDVVDERLVLGGDQLADVVHREPALVGARVLRGHDQVDAVGAVADLVLDPREVDLELLLRVRDGAEHAEPAGLGDGRHHVAAVGEGEDGNVDAEHVGDRGLHGIGQLDDLSSSSRLKQGTP
jgi:hypothetical protein